MKKEKSKIKCAQQGDGEKKAGISKDRKGRGRKDREESHMLQQKRAEEAFILPNACGFNATQRFFCCCSTRQRFTPTRKAVVTSSQLTESLSRRDKGLESSWWSQAFKGKRGCCVCVCVYLCFVRIVSLHVCVCLWELGLPFYSVRLLEQYS